MTSLTVVITSAKWCLSGTHGTVRRLCLIDLYGRQMAQTGHNMPEFSTAIPFSQPWPFRTDPPDIFDTSGACSESYFSDFSFFEQCPRHLIRWRL